MKMAKASESDLNMAMELASMLEGFERDRTFPETTAKDQNDDLPRPFYSEDSDDCKDAMRMILEVLRRGSLFRVIYGMAVILDPNNEVVDPNADTLEIHPRFVRALAATSASKA